MADPLREALAALAEQWARFGRGDPLDPWTAHATDLRAVLAAHPERTGGLPSCVRCRGTGTDPVRIDHDPDWCRDCGGSGVGEPAEPPVPEGAVRVRIAVAVDAEGEWDSAGASAYYQESVAAYDARREMGGDPSRLRLSWVEAWVPRPEAEQVVEGRVEERE